MNLYKNKYRSDSTRLKIWDYTTPWWYFVTINTKRHRSYFGNIKNGEMVLNDFGGIADKFWREIPKHYKSIDLDYYIIMPNHIHGIIILNLDVKTGHAPSLRQSGPSLSNVIGSYKSAVSKWAHQNKFPHFSWQINYYDRIIRNQRELDKLRIYICENPLAWEYENGQTGDPNLNRL